MSVSTTKFKVEGVGPFPLDMLRYDQCWPKAQDDVHEMGTNTAHPKRTVTLLTHTRVTEKRWASFGWTVTSKETF